MLQLSTRSIHKHNPQVASVCNIHEGNYQMCPDITQCSSLFNTTCTSILTKTLNNLSRDIQSHHTVDTPGPAAFPQWFRIDDIGYGDHVFILFHKQFCNSLQNPNLLLKEEIDIVLERCTNCKWKWLVLTSFFVSKSYFAIWHKICVVEYVSKELLFCSFQSLCSYRYFYHTCGNINILYVKKTIFFHKYQLPALFFYMCVAWW